MPSDVSEIDIKALRKELTEKWEERFGVSSQCFSILNDFLDRFVAKIERGELSIEHSRSHLEEAASLLESIHTGLHFFEKRQSNKSNLKDLWYPPATNRLGEIITRPEHWNSLSPIHFVLLDDSIKLYLNRKELQHDLIDWCLVNALIFHELATYSEAIDSGELFGQIDYAHLFSGGEPLKWLSFRAGILITGFLLRWIIPPSIIVALYHFEYNTAALYFGGAYAVYLAFRTLTLPHRWKAKREQNARGKSAVKIRTAIKRSWIASSYQVYSPKRVLDLVLEVEEKGGLFMPAIHSILARAIQRDPTTLSS